MMLGMNFKITESVGIGCEGDKGKMQTMIKHQPQEASDLFKYFIS